MEGFKLQKFIERETLNVAKARGIPVLQVKQHFSSPEKTAKRILQLVQAQYPAIASRLKKA